MSASHASGALGKAARRQRRLTLQYLRHVAVAEAHRGRARAGLTKVESILAYGLGEGFDMKVEVGQLAELRQALADAEAGLGRARQMAGLDLAA